MHPLRVFIRLVIPLCAAWAAFGAVKVEPVVMQAQEKLAALPVRFEPNAGQWTPEVRFAARTGSYSLALTAREALVTLPQQDGAPARRVSIALEGAQASPRIEGLELLQARGSYLLGNRRAAWRTGVPQYRKVLYRGVYEGIDLVYYGNGRELEYDFLLEPGADPSRIRLRYRGADRVALSDDGDLLLHAGASRLVQKRPVAYQFDDSGARREVAVRYRMAGKTAARIEVGDYDRSRPLVIDPVLQYASLFGGERADSVAAVKIDREGMVWIAGTISDGGIPAVGNPYQSEFAYGGTDIFVARLDPRAQGDASLLYFTYLGGDGADVCNDMALDQFGNVYLTGYTSSAEFPLGGFAYQTKPLGVTVDDLGIATGSIHEAFVVKLQPSVGGELSLAYSSYLGGSDADEGNGIAVDAAGQIYIVGSTTSEDFPLTESAAQTIRWGDRDAFIARFDPFALDAPASLVYSTYFGGNSYDDGRAITATPEGVVYVAGSTLSDEFPWAGNAFQEANAGGGDGFLARVITSASGPASIPYATFFGGSGYDEIYRVAVDPEGKLLLAGATLSSDLPVTFGALRETAPGGDGDGFIVRLDTDAPRESALLYGTYLGGSGGDVIYGLDVDQSGVVWVTGYTYSADFPTTGDALVQFYPGGLNVFAASFDPQRFGDASLLYSTYLGQFNISLGYSIAAGGDGTVAIAGETSFPPIQTTGNAARRDYAGGMFDGFVVVLAP